MIEKTHRTSRRNMGPAWLTGANSTTTADNEAELVGYAQDILIDANEEATLQSHLIRFPQQDPYGTPAPPQALAALGRDRRVVRGINESSESYAVRLKKWLTDRKTAGNPFTLMQKLAEYVGDGTVKVRTVDMAGNWFTRDVDGTRTYDLATGNWDWDDTAASSWSRFWVIIYPNGIWTKGTDPYGDPDIQYGDGHVYGTSATRDQIRTLQFLVNDWKAQGTRCVNIILAYDPASFDPSAPEPDGLWGSWSKVSGGVRVPSRLSTASYLRGST